MTRMTPGVKRVRRSDAPIASTDHQVAEPRRTPATRTAGLAGPPSPPRPRVAASAANERMVAGLAIVSPSVETYAHGRPVPDFVEASAGRFERSKRMRSPSPINTAPPTSAKGLRPLEAALITTANPNAAIAA